MVIHNDKDDSEFIAQCYEKYEQKIYRLAYSILRDSWQAEELVQETFIRVIGHRDLLRRMPEARQGIYISKIAKSIAIDTYRKNKKMSESIKIIDEDSATALENEIWHQSASSSNDDMADQIGNREILRKILSMLSEEDALILKLRIIRQLSVKETAAVMQMTETAVRKKCERAIKKARKLLIKEMMLDGK